MTNRQNMVNTPIEIEQRKLSGSIGINKMCGSFAENLKLTCKQIHGNVIDIKYQSKSIV